MSSDDDDDDYDDDYDDDVDDDYDYDYDDDDDDDDDGWLISIPALLLEFDKERAQVTLSVLIGGPRSYPVLLRTASTQQQRCFH